MKKNKVIYEKANNIKRMQSGGGRQKMNESKDGKDREQDVKVQKVQKGK